MQNHLSLLPSPQGVGSGTAWGGGGVSRGRTVEARSEQSTKQGCRHKRDSKFLLWEQRDQERERKEWLNTEVKILFIEDHSPCPFCSLRCFNHWAQGLALSRLSENNECMNGSRSVSAFYVPFIQPNLGPRTYVPWLKSLGEPGPHGPTARVFQWLHSALPRPPPPPLAVPSQSFPLSVSPFITWRKIYSPHRTVAVQLKKERKDEYEWSLKYKGKNYQIQGE